jgi:hypothetical protein
VAEVGVAEVGVGRSPPPVTVASAARMATRAAATAASGHRADRPVDGASAMPWTSRASESFVIHSARRGAAEPADRQFECLKRLA